MLYSDYDNDLFTKCLTMLEKRWIEPSIFGILRFGRKLDSIPTEKTAQLSHLLRKYDSQDVQFLIVELLESVPFDHTAHFDPDFVFDILSHTVPNHGNGNQSGYHWKEICQKLITWDKKYTLQLLNMLLTQMKDDYHLSHDHDVEALAYKLVQTDPVGSWQIIKHHLEETLPYWRDDLLSWLKGGLGGFDEIVSSLGVIGLLPIVDILAWIEQDPEPRSRLIAHAAPKTLDGTDGQLTRILLHKYGKFRGVQEGISAIFHSGGWSGSSVLHFKQIRNKFREWLAAGFEIEVIQWVEHEIEYLDEKIEQAEIEEERLRFD